MSEEELLFYVISLKRRASEMDVTMRRWERTALTRGNRDARGSEGSMWCEKRMSDLG